MDLNADSLLEILFLHKNPDLEKKLKDCLDQSDSQINWTVVGTMDEALKLVYQTPFDLVLFDFSSVAANNLSLFIPFSTEVIFLPIVTLVPNAEADLGRESVLAGAQGWLTYESIYPELVTRVFSYARERHQLKEALRGMSLIDSATGLYNKTGFEAIIYPQLQMVKRQRRATLLFSVDIDDLEDLDARYGVTEKQTAVIRASQVLWKSFRRSDVIGRIGMEEFAVFCPDSNSTHADLIIERTKENLKSQKKSEAWPYHLQLKMGHVELDEKSPESLDDLIRRARLLKY